MNLDEIRKDYRYGLADNGVLRRANGTPVFSDGRMIYEAYTSELAEKTTAMDKRLHIISFGNTLDLQEYVQYYLGLASIANTQISTRTVTTGRFVAYLANGYLPMYMPPTFFGEQMFNDMKRIIQGMGLRYIETEVLRIDGSRVESDSADIWVSKLDAAERLGKPLDKVSVIDLYRSI